MPHGTVVTDGSMHVRIQFFSYWVWYYTYVVKHYLFIAVGALYVTMPCRVELFNRFSSCSFLGVPQRELLGQSIWRNQWHICTSLASRCLLMHCIVRIV